MRKKECLAMLLAGGQGSRLYALTESNAKPAVSFGGKYRIIDFGLSNCTNSGIDTVGVLVQYRPLILSKYLGTGKAWDLDVQDGGVYVLPPYETQAGGAWYEGTADAIYHNIDFIDSYNPEYVLILSGDHLYKCDYNEMLECHKEKNSDLTIAVRTVPWEEASRFGIMTCDENDNIVHFDEKPEHPMSNLASMGIYIFSWPILRKELLLDHEDKKSSHDFGKDIIPKLLAEKKTLTAYHFDGYWRDVGTVDSYYNAQMDLLKMGDECEFRLYDKNFKIYSNSSIHAPHYIGPDAVIKNSMVCNDCEIYGQCIHSIISNGAVVEEGAVVEDSILLPNAVVRKGCHLKRTIVNEDVTVREGIAVGDDDQIVVIGSGSKEAEQEKED